MKKIIFIILLTTAFTINLFSDGPLVFINGGWNSFNLNSPVSAECTGFGGGGEIDFPVLENTFYCIGGYNFVYLLENSTGWSGNMHKPFIGAGYMLTRESNISIMPNIGIEYNLWKIEQHGTDEFGNPNQLLQDVTGTQGIIPFIGAKIFFSQIGLSMDLKYYIGYKKDMPSQLSAGLSFNFMPIDETKSSTFRKTSFETASKNVENNLINADAFLKIGKYDKAFEIYKETIKIALQNQLLDINEKCEKRLKQIAKVYFDAIKKATEQNKYDFANKMNDFLNTNGLDNTNYLDMNSLQQIQLKIGQVFLENNTQSDTGIALCENIINKNFDNKYVLMAKNLLAKYYFTKANALSENEKISALENLLQKYPNSDYAQKAKEILSMNIYQNYLDSSKELPLNDQKTTLEELIQKYPDTKGQKKLNELLAKVNRKIDKEAQQAAAREAEKDRDNSRRRSIWCSAMNNVAQNKGLDLNYSSNGKNLIIKMPFSYMQGYDFQQFITDAMEAWGALGGEKIVIYNILTGKYITEMEIPEQYRP